MPRDDLSIDFVKRMPPVESLLDPAMILDEWINRTQNLPEEIRFMQDEIAEKDRQYDRCIKEIDDRDSRIQKWIKTNGSHQDNPKEPEYRATISKNYDMAEKLAGEKVALALKLQTTMDKHLRQLDMQIKSLYDRNEPGFTDPDELPSLVRTSAANMQPAPAMRPLGQATAAALTPISNNASQAAVRAAHPQLKTTQSLQHGSASAPATPAASMILARPTREGSVGPGNGTLKRGPRANSNAPTTSSGLARHSSLGPGTPKAHYHVGTSVQRAGSAGPRANTKAAGGMAGRKSGTPSGGGLGRKKASAAGAGVGGGPGGAGNHKSGLSRVKRAARNSPSSAAESELSEGDSGTGDESDVRTGGRGTPATTGAARSSSHPHSNSQLKEGSHERESSGARSGSHHHHHKDGSNGPGGAGVGAGASAGGAAGPGLGTMGDVDDDGDDEDAMDVDDDEGGDDNKMYCLCQNVSFGDMVACDNPSCPYEWFHLSCVGLKNAPSGTWFCPVCTEERKKKGLK